MGLRRSAYPVPSVFPRLEAQSRIGQHACNVSAPQDPSIFSAEVTTRDQRKFSAAAAHLTHASVFLETQERLGIGDRLHVSLAGLELDAEVGFVSSSPAGVVAAFRPSPESESLLEALIGRVRTRSRPSLAPDEPWGEKTVPGDADEVEMAAATALAREAAADTANSAALSPFGTGEFRALTPNPFSSQTPTPFSDVALPRVPMAAPEPAPPAAAADAPSPTEGSLPELTADGTLRFASPGAFKSQFDANLVHGGVVARSTPLPIGSHKMLRFEVPGVASDVQVSARVGFVGQGTVGFMIDTFALQRPRLEALLQQIA